MNNKSIIILLGFTQKTAEMDKHSEERLRKRLGMHGIEPTFIMRHKKSEIVKYLETNRECSHVVLMESADGNKWNENELAELVDDRNINIVLCIPRKREKEINFLTTLYAAGITNVIFEDKDGVPEEMVAELLAHPRSRREAREYYRIDTKNIQIRTLTNEAYANIIVKLADPDYGATLMTRFLEVAETINPYQMADLIENIPDNIRQELEDYHEYGQIVDILKEKHIKVPYRRPKNLKSIDDDKPRNKSAEEALTNKGFYITAEAFREADKKKIAFPFPFPKKKKEKKEDAEDSERKDIPISNEEREDFDDFEAIGVNRWGDEAIDIRTTGESGEEEINIAPSEGRAFTKSESEEGEEDEDSFNLY